MRKALKHLGYIKSPRLGARIATGFVKGMLLKMPVLRSVELAINYECNAKCDMCYARDLLDIKKTNLSVGQIKSIWGQAHKLGAVHVNITGGEPLLEKDLVRIIKYFKPYKTIITINTNGVLLNEKKIDELEKARVDIIKISIDSPLPQEHDKSRGYKGCFESAVSALRYLKKKKTC